MDNSLLGPRISKLAYDPTRLITLMARYFNAGEADLIVDLFAAKFPVFTETGLSLMGTRSDIRVTVERLMAAARENGVAKIEHRIISTEPSSEGKSSTVRVAWRYLGPNGHLISDGDVKYYCGKDADGIVRILMIEYIKTAFPDAVSEKRHPSKPHPSIN